MSGSITCPSCQAKFKGKPGMEGKKVKCPRCGDPFTVRAEGKSEGKSEKADAKTKPGKAEPPKEKPMEVEPPKDDAAYGIGRIDTAPRCPNCAKEMLSEEAVICVHCGYNTLTREHGETKKLIAITPAEHLTYLLPAIIVTLIFLFMVINLIAESTFMVEVYQSWKMDWATQEWIRMWRTIVQLNVLWGLGMFAFKTFALAPTPPEKVKE